MIGYICLNQYDLLLFAITENAIPDKTKALFV